MELRLAATFMDQRLMADATIFELENQTRITIDGGKNVLPSEI